METYGHICGPPPRMGTPATTGAYSQRTYKKRGLAGGPFKYKDFE